MYGEFGRAAGADRRSGLISQGDGGEQLAASHFGAGLGDEHVATKTSLMMLDSEGDLLSWEAKAVEAPPEVSPTDVAVSLDGGTGPVRKRCLEPAAAQSKHVAQLIAHRRDNIVWR